jgi:hypothetical protein
LRIYFAIVKSLLFAVIHQDRVFFLLASGFWTLASPATAGLVYLEYFGRLSTGFVERKERVSLMSFAITSRVQINRIFFVFREGKRRC